jgi:carbonyl reductase 1
LGLHPKFHQLDIDNEASIVTFKDYLLDTYPDGIDVLVNNAAIAFKHDATEPFGFQAEETIRVNFLGTLNLCQVLFPLLKKHARVVNVSSSSGFLQQVRGKEPQATELRKQLADPSMTYKELIHLINNFVT